MHVTGIACSDVIMLQLYWTDLEIGQHKLVNTDKKIG
jgi:hypothetical protein